MSTYIIHYFEGTDNSYAYVGTDDRNGIRLGRPFFSSEKEAKKYGEYEIKHGYSGCVYRIEEVKPYMNT